MPEANLLLDDSVLLAFVSLSSIILIYKLRQTLVRNRKRKDRERIYFLMLMRKLNEIAFFFRIDQTENKLPTYRLLLTTHSIIRKFVKDMVVEFGDEVGLAKDLAYLHEEIERSLFDPDIAHMLYDTEESKIGASGKSKISKIQSTFYKCLSKYDKSIIC